MLFFQRQLCLLKQILKFSDHETQTGKRLFDLDLRTEEDDHRSITKSPSDNEIGNKIVFDTKNVLSPNYFARHRISTVIAETLTNMKEVWSFCHISRHFFANIISCLFRDLWSSFRFCVIICQFKSDALLWLGPVAQETISPQRPGSRTDKL